MISKIERFGQVAFGYPAWGQTVWLVTLRNASGMEAQVTSWGATLVSLTLGDPGPSVVLGSDIFGRYAAGFPAAAATIGRVANRIAFARFTLDGVEHVLPANDGRHHLHGGPGGFAHQLWTMEPAANEVPEQAVCFRHRSVDDEQGYPGNLDASVTYVLADSDELRIRYSAETDQPTLVNLTNHAYFNLSGHGDVLRHELWLDAEGYTPVDDDKIPTGEIAPLTDTPFDFRSPCPIGARFGALPVLFGGYDHNLVLRKDRDLRLPCARLADPASGRVLELLTTEPGVQLYTGNHFENLICAGGRPYPRHGGVCLETQHFPDSPHHPQFPSVVVRPGDTWTSETTWRFRRRAS